MGKELNPFRVTLCIHIGEGTQESALALEAIDEGLNRRFGGRWHYGDDCSELDTELKEE